MYTDIQVEYVYMIHPVFNYMLLLTFLNWFNAHLAQYFYVQNILDLKGILNKTCRCILLFLVDTLLSNIWLGFMDRDICENL